MKAIKLLKEHTHDRQIFPAGSVITVPTHTANYLQVHGIGKPARQPPKRRDTVANHNH